MSSLGGEILQVNGQKTLHGTNCYIPTDSPTASLFIMGGGGIQSLGPTLQPRGGGSLAPPLQESVYSLIDEFSAMSLATLGEEEIVDTSSVSSTDQVTK